MRWLILIFLLTITSLKAATITITVRNDSGNVVSTTTLNTSNTILTSLNQWRLAQILVPAQPEAKDVQGNVIPAKPAVLKYPAVEDWWRAVITDFVKDHILNDYHPLIVAEKAKIDAANTAIKTLKDAAIQ